MERDWLGPGRSTAGPLLERSETLLAAVVMSVNCLNIKVRIVTKSNEGSRAVSIKQDGVPESRLTFTRH